jgi:hypothetical protein
VLQDKTETPRAFPSDLLSRLMVPNIEQPLGPERAGSAGPRPSTPQPYSIIKPPTYPCTSYPRLSSKLPGLDDASPIGFEKFDRFRLYSYQPSDITVSQLFLKGLVTSLLPELIRSSAVCLVPGTRVDMWVAHLSPEPSTDGLVSLRYPW